MTWLGRYCRLAGALDAATGALLIAQPATTLSWMGAGAATLARIEADPTWMRWIGVFVAAVGLLYWLPEVWTGAERAARRRFALEATALVRLAVATFVAVALWRGALGPAFASVLATDLGLACVQLTWIRRLDPGVSR